MSRTVLLTGATGFVGRHVYPELTRAGWQVRCLTRNAGRARDRWPDREWVAGDLASRDDVSRALEGCDSTLYLAHGMAEGGHDFRRREVETAERFRDAAAAAG